MNVRDVVSLILFCFFLLSYIIKLVLLYQKNKIKANVLAKIGKDKEVLSIEIFVKTTTFLWGLLWFIQSVTGSYLENYLRNIMPIYNVYFVGLFLITVGIIIFIIAMKTMKDSWRVGIDKTTKTRLISDGVYKFSRNPAFVGFDLMFIGLFITYPNILTLIIMGANITAIHLLIKQEEKHLMDMLGKEYLEYKKNTPRYLGCR